MKPDTLNGRVIRMQSGFYTVQTAQGLFTCHVRGRLKRRHDLAGMVVVGDLVEITAAPGGKGSIEAVEPRKSVLSRQEPTAHGQVEQVMLANLDQVMLVFACANPQPHLRMLDRFLVICEKQGFPIWIIANKVDLVGVKKAREIFSIYPSIGYDMLFTSVKTGSEQGIEELKHRLEGKVTAFAGPSGVGKTSLLNTIQPHLGLNISSVNSVNKGRHTTVVRQLFPLEQSDGYIADMPGLRSLALWDIQPEELDGYFPELRELVASCQFNNCTHQNEPGCAVRAAVAAGQVHPERYDSYLRLRNGEE